ncbi:Na+/H+ antiporter subunit E [Halorientalis marina]|uniref:Na+/H+ antiporter subunit E n=1 Tax=Halorientalis marina TaxID=2931976 RepID=UPI001FF4F36E|nr:Na+/H+ antiporter subunit E [Halorientalis marina]
MTRRWPVAGVGLALLWLFVRGVTLTPTRIAAELLTGLLLGLPLAYLLRRFYQPEVELGGVVRGVPPAMAYVALFLRELATANVDVAYRVLAPSMPIRPTVVELPLRVESDLAITTIANSITLTPGTLTMDYDDDTNTFYIHTIAGGDRDSVVEPIRAWEDYAIRIFGEDADPGDPAPPRPSTRASAADDQADGTTDADDQADGTTDADDQADGADGTGGETDG